MLRAVLGDGCSLRVLARARGLPEGGRSYTLVVDELASVLETLADHYDQADRHGLAGILDPRRRPVRTKPATAPMADLMEARTMAKPARLGPARTILLGADIAITLAAPCIYL